MSRRIVHLVSLYEPLEFIHQKIRNLAACDLSETVVYFSDCSPDPTWRALRRHLDPGVLPFEAIVDHHDWRRGIYWTWNHMIRRTPWATYYANAGDDDVLAPNYFSALSSYLDANPGVRVAGSLWANSPHRLNTWPPKAPGIKTGRPWFPDGVSHFPMWRSSAHGEVGYFNPECRVFGDIEFWMRVDRRFGSGSLGAVDECLGIFRCDGANRSQFMEGGHDRDVWFGNDGRRQMDSGLIGEFGDRTNGWYHACFERVLGKRFWTFKNAIRMFLEAGGRTIVETGTFRDWDVGGSTAVFCEVLKRVPGSRLFSIDVDRGALRRAARMIGHPGIHYLPGNSPDVLRMLTGHIDLLYLDSMDARSGLPYHEHNLAEFHAALPLIHPRTVLLLDDDQGSPSGKPWLTRGELSRLGWRCVMEEYQSLWVHPDWPGQVPAGGAPVMPTPE